MLIERTTLNVYADYHQFYLWDCGMGRLAPEEYDEDDVERRIKTAPYVFVVLPGRNSTVPVDVEIHDSEPPSTLNNPENWDHVAEASLELPTGQLEVHECTGGPVAEFHVNPGWYRVRSFQGDLGTIDKRRNTGRDRYLVVLWPAPTAELKIIKQWLAP